MCLKDNFPSIFYQLVLGSNIISPYALFKNSPYWLTVKTTTKICQKLNKQGTCILRDDRQIERQCEGVHPNKYKMISIFSSFTASLFLSI